MLTFLFFLSSFLSFFFFPIYLGIVKKLLFALKGEVFNDEILPDLLSAFKALVSTNMSADVLRSVSLFVTYALYSADHHKSLRGKKSNVQLRPMDYSGVSASQYNQSISKRRHQAGLLVLEMFSELLCDASSTANIKKFARTVTNKVREAKYVLENLRLSILSY